jgi:ubiquinone/menaquinone biosynthesis C-methylase UbiE
MANKKDYLKWKKYGGGKTPGTTPVPKDLPKYIEPVAKNVVVDVGCGWGRISHWLYFNGYSVIGTDINEKEISEAERVLKKDADDKDHTISFQVDDIAKKINLPKNLVDAVVVNAVFVALTNIKQRQKAISEIFRILKPRGVLYLAEFGRTSNKDYPLDYRKHSLITGEEGTIVAFKPELKITFKEKADKEIRALGKPENINYFAHHFEEDEIRELIKDFEILKFRKEIFVSRSGNKVNGYVIYAKKPS